ncbi:MAG: hypothetical protein GMKNLPBB_00822 [Myxococcota bacterium]|nr:hypothetical protein [Myxococcota bacterium]
MQRIHEPAAPPGVPAPGASARSRLRAIDPRLEFRWLKPRRRWCVVMMERRPVLLGAINGGTLAGMEDGEYRVLTLEDGRGRFVSPWPWDGRIEQALRDHDHARFGGARAWISHLRAGAEKAGRERARAALDAAEDAAMDLRAALSGRLVFAGAQPASSPSPKHRLENP